MIKIFKLTFLFSIITSCAAMKEAQQDWLIKNCNETAAKANAIDDASNGKTSAAYRYDSCPVDISSKAKLAYVEAYQSVPKKITPTPSPVISTGELSGELVCRLSTAVETFEAKGLSTGEGKYKVISQCKKKYMSSYTCNQNKIKCFDTLRGVQVRQRIGSFFVCRDYRGGKQYEASGKSREIAVMYLNRACEKDHGTFSCKYMRPNCKNYTDY